MEGAITSEFREIFLAQIWSFWLPVALPQAANWWIEPVGVSVLKSRFKKAWDALSSGFVSGLG